MGARSRSSRTPADRPSGRHALRSRSIAAELVRDARIGPSDVVLEVGAGDGRLTEALAPRASRVVAVELDRRSIDRLRARFADDAHVLVVHGDALHVALPREPFRAFGNIPFGVTNALLRRLLDGDAPSLDRFDLIVQLEAARKRTEVWRPNALNISRSPWWELSLVRRIPRAAFVPVPSVDAAVLRATRRTPPLVDPDRRSAFVELVRGGFRRPTSPIRRTLPHALPRLAWKRLARDRGLSIDATPIELDAWDWVALFRVVHERPGAG